MYPTRTTTTTGTFHPATHPTRPAAARPAPPAGPAHAPAREAAPGFAAPDPVAVRELRADRAAPDMRAEPVRVTRGADAAHPAREAVAYAVAAGAGRVPVPEPVTAAPARPEAGADPAVRPAAGHPAPPVYPGPESAARPRPARPEPVPVAWSAYPEAVPVPERDARAGSAPAPAPPRAAHPADHGPARAGGPAPHPDPAEPRPGRWVDAERAPARGDVPAARGGADEPQPQARAEAGAPQGSGVPGPGVAEIVARAVTRGMDAREEREEREADDTQNIPHVPPVPRLRPGGTAVTEVPVHLPFLAHPTHPRPAPPRPGPPAARPAAPRPPAGRRVPRGDDRLREHRGPVLPGWTAVVVGGLALSGCLAVLLRAGAVPAPLVAAFGAAPRAYHGLSATHWPPLAFLGIVALVALGGLGRARAGHAWVLTLFGRYRGTVRRTGLTWISPLLLRRRVDVRLRHWRSEPMPAVDSGGLALQVVVQVVWQVKDTARATLAVEDHTDYLAEQVESAMARVLSRLPADAFHEDAATLRDAEAVGDALTRLLAAETEAVGIEVFSAQPTRIEYAPEVADAMRRRRVAAIDAKHRDTVLTSVVDAVDDTVHRLTSRGIVELDDYERKALVKDLTVAFYTGRGDQ
ncbi:SPFH domain-containing protein [Streptomyces sp. NPDC048507]|uniref:SPFH domain-containing protein n=1 Tax=Streptomyces sp. NPDC048507 TaxID=3365560 RepID=UPI00371BA66F